MTCSVTHNTPVCGTFFHRTLSTATGSSIFCTTGSCRLVRLCLSLTAIATDRHKLNVISYGYHIAMYRILYDYHIMIVLQCIASHHNMLPPKSVITAKLCRCFHSCIFHPCIFYHTTVSTLTFSTPIEPYRCFHSCVFHPFNFLPRQYLHSRIFHRYRTVPTYPLLHFPPPHFFTMPMFPLPHFQRPQHNLQK